MKTVFNYTLNNVVRMLDGQWQGVRLASDGRVYFFGGSHSPGVSAPFFRYDPPVGKVELLNESMTKVCGEDATQVPTQGKVHSDLLEHEGWLYWGTHLSDYTPAGKAAYTGAHLVGYELQTGRFRDFGIIHPNFTNYAGIGLDRQRGRIWFYTTPFSAGDGPHLHRIEIATGQNEDLGLVAPWVDRQGHGQPSMQFFVNRQGDCFFTLRGEGPLFVGRAESTAIERYPNALPGGTKQWYCVRALDQDRALVVLESGIWLFDSRQFDGSSSAFTLVKKVETPGLIWAYLAVDRERFYWNSRSQQPDPATGRHVTHLWSSSLKNPSETIDHGTICDAAGRVSWFVGDLVSDGHGRLYTAGRWYVRPDEVEKIGVDRGGHIVAVFFTVLDVSEDLRPAGRAGLTPGLR